MLSHRPPDDGREMAVAVAAPVRLRTREDGKEWLFIGRTVCRAALKRETPDSMFSMALFCT